MRDLFNKVSSVCVTSNRRETTSTMGIKRGEETRRPSCAKGRRFGFFLSIMFPCSRLAVLPCREVMGSVGNVRPGTFVKDVGFGFRLVTVPKFPYGPIRGRYFKLCMSKR